MRKILLFVIIFVLAGTVSFSQTKEVKERLKKDPYFLREYFREKHEPLDLGIDLDGNPILLSEVKVRRPLSKASPADTLEIPELTPYELKKQMKLDSLRQVKEDSIIQSLYVSGDKFQEKSNPSENDSLLLFIGIISILLFAMGIALFRWKKVK